jgi:hypothetical protein
VCYTGVELEGVSTYCSNCRKAKPAYSDERIRNLVLDYLYRITSIEISNSTLIIELSHDKIYYRNSYQVSKVKSEIE